MKSEDLGFSSAQMRQLKKLHADINRNIQKAKKLLDNKHEMAGTLHKIIPEGESENAHIEHVAAEATDKALMFENLAAAVKGRPDRVCPPGIYTRLHVKVGDTWEIMMTDAPYELHSSRPLMDNAHGHVLIAGLGIGASLLPVLRKKSVKSVLVVEKNDEVIKLVAEHVFRAAGPDGDKLVVDHCDAFEWAPDPLFDRNLKPFDCIWLDIWPRISVENLPEITKLKRRFGKYLNKKSKKAWMGAWEEKWLRQQKAESDAIEKAIWSTVGGKMTLKIPKGGKVTNDKGEEVRL